MVEMVEVILVVVGVVVGPFAPKRTNILDTTSRFEYYLVSQELGPFRL